MKAVAYSVKNEKDALLAFDLNTICTSESTRQHIEPITSSLEANSTTFMAKGTCDEHKSIVHEDSVEHKQLKDYVHHMVDSQDNRAKHEVALEPKRVDNAPKSRQLNFEVPDYPQLLILAGSDTDEYYEESDPRPKSKEDYFIEPPAKKLFQRGKLVKLVITAT
jgi:hypothetical protein